MSPRPRKRRCCRCPLPGGSGPVFKPAGTPLARLERVPLERDELEALILCDRDGLTQEQAGNRMGISRGTVQRLVSVARKKIADVLAGGKALVIQGLLEEETNRRPGDERRR